MQWEDQGIVIKKAYFSERGMIVTVLTQNHGIHSGLLRFGQISIGDDVKVIWTARKAEQLGIWHFDPIKSYAVFFMRDVIKLQTFQFLCRLLNEMLLERSSCPAIFDTFHNFLEIIQQQSWFYSVILLELQLMQHLGIILDFSSVTLSTSVDPLFYVSPKTGKVVTKSFGDPYKAKLLTFPQFLLQPAQQWNLSKIDLQNVFSLIHHFLFHDTQHEKLTLQHKDIWIKNISLHRNNA